MLGGSSGHPRHTSIFEANVLVRLQRTEPPLDGQRGALFCGRHRAIPWTRGHSRGGSFHESTPPRLKSYRFGGRTRQRFVPPIFFTVPPIPAFRMALTALPMSFCGTCSTFLGAPLFFSRWAAEFNPAGEPLRSTSVASSTTLGERIKPLPPWQRNLGSASGTSGASLCATMCGRLWHCSNSPFYLALYSAYGGQGSTGHQFWCPLRRSKSRLPGMTKTAAPDRDRLRNSAVGYE